MEERLWELITNIEREREREREREVCDVISEHNNFKKG